MYVDSITITPDRCDASRCDLVVTATIKPNTIDETNYSVTLFTRTAEGPWTPIATQRGVIPESERDTDPNVAYKIAFPPIVFTKTGSYIVGAKDNSEPMATPTQLTLVETVVTELNNNTPTPSFATSLAGSPYTYIGATILGAGMIYILVSDERTDAFRTTLRDAYTHSVPKLQRGYDTVVPKIKSRVRKTGEWILDEGIPMASKGVQSAKDKIQYNIKKINPTIENHRQKMERKRQEMPAKKNPPST
jgi:hypothetical protein